MKYQTQRIAYAYFIVAMALFAVQVTLGLVLGWIYVSPNFMSELLPFNIARMLHTNSLVVWLLLGFFGATYYILPEESEREIHSPLLAYIQLGILVIGTAGVVVTYLFDLFHGNWLLGKEGREFLEQPKWVKVGIAVAAVIFMYNITMTVLKGRKTVISIVLLLGLWGLAIFFLFSFYNPVNLVRDKFYWWWVVHLWVEGVWELIMAALLAFVLIKVTGVDRPVHCVCVHLGLTGGGRRRQMEALAERMEDLAPDGAPLIIAGDFNDWRNRADRLLADRLGLVEAFGGGIGRPARSYPSALPFFRLDRIYVRGFRVRRAEVHFGAPWAQISDHAALTAELEPLA